MTPKLGCRAGRWCKNDPQIRVSGRSMMQEWPPNLTSELPGRWKWPPNSMLGVVGRVKRTPRFDARGTGLPRFARNDGRRGDWITTLRSQWREEWGLDCFASLAMTGGGRLDCFASLTMTGRGETGLLHFARNDGRGVSGLLHFARNDGRRETGLLHFARNDGRRETGLLHFARNDGEIQFFCSFRYFIF